MIERLYVHNFRCLENFELDLSARPSALLIGKNGAGKSTVRAAFELLQQIGQGTNRLGRLVVASDFARARADLPMRFELNARIGAARFRYDLALELPPGFREVRIAEEQLRVDGQVIFERDRAQVSMPTVNGGAGARFLVDWHLVALPVVQDHSHGDLLERFKQWLARMLILAPVPSLMSADARTEAPAPLPSCANFGDWLSGLLNPAPAAVRSCWRKAGRRDRSSASGTNPTRTSPWPRSATSSAICAGSLRTGRSSLPPLTIPRSSGIFPTRPRSCSGATATWSRPECGR